jgi:hypothetical protein
MREFHLARGFLLNSQAENRARQNMGLSESTMKANHSLQGRGVVPAPHNGDQHGLEHGTLMRRMRVVTKGLDEARDGASARVDRPGKYALS